MKQGASKLHRMTAVYTVLIITAVLFTCSVCYLTTSNVCRDSCRLFINKVELILFLFTFTLSFRLCLSRTCRYWPSFLFLIVALTLAMNNHIQWGQELFGLGGSSLHGKGYAILPGSMLNLFVVPDNWQGVFVALFWTLYGIAYPLALKLEIHQAILLDRAGVLPPPMWLWPFFMAAVILPLLTTSWYRVHPESLFLSIALAATSFFHLLLHKYSNILQDPAS